MNRCDKFDDLLRYYLRDIVFKDLSVYGYIEGDEAFEAFEDDLIKCGHKFVIRSSRKHPQKPVKNSLLSEDGSTGPTRGQKGKSSLILI